MGEEEGDAMYALSAARSRFRPLGMAVSVRGGRAGPVPATRPVNRDAASSPEGRGAAGLREEVWADGVGLL